MACRWEAHLWVKELGRQVYLGGYEHEEHAAEAYDVAALKCKGTRVRTNFPISRSVLAPPRTGPPPHSGTTRMCHVEDRAGPDGKHSMQKVPQCCPYAHLQTMKVSMCSLPLHGIADTVCAPPRRTCCSPGKNRRQLIMAA